MPVYHTSIHEISFVSYIPIVFHLSNSLILVGEKCYISLSHVLILFPLKNSNHWTIIQIIIKPPVVLFLFSIQSPILSAFIHQKHVFCLIPFIWIYGGYMLFKDTCFFHPLSTNVHQHCLVSFPWPCWPKIHPPLRSLNLQNLHWNAAQIPIIHHWNIKKNRLND